MTLAFDMAGPHLNSRMLNPALQIVLWIGQRVPPARSFDSFTSSEEGNFNSDAHER